MLLKERLMALPIYGGAGRSVGVRVGTCLAEERAERGEDRDERTPAKEGGGGNRSHSDAGSSADTGAGTGAGAGGGGGGSSGGGGGGGGAHPPPRPAPPRGNPKYVTKLLNNYRSHERLLALPSKLFYGDELRAW